MQADLREFLTRFARTVLITLVPVVFVAFTSMPMNLGRHPGEQLPPASPSYAHMT